MIDTDTASDDAVAFDHGSPRSMLSALGMAINHGCRGNVAVKAGHTQSSSTPRRKLWARKSGSFHGRGEKHAITPQGGTGSMAARGWGNHATRLQSKAPEKKHAAEAIVATIEATHPGLGLVTLGTSYEC